MGQANQYAKKIEAKHKSLLNYDSCIEFMF